MFTYYLWVFGTCTGTRFRVPHCWSDIFDIKQFFKNIPNNAHEGLYDYTEEETTETEAELYDPLTRLAKDIELGNLANIQSDDNFSDTDSDNDLEEILDMEIDDTDCMTIETNTNSFMV